MQAKSTIRRQVFSRGLIESDSPMIEGAVIEEALYDLLDCLWRTYRISQHHGNLVHQAIVHQTGSVRGQKMQILREQTKERNTIPPIAADQFCFWITVMGLWFHERDVLNLSLYVHHHEISIQQRVIGSRVLPLMVKRYPDSQSLSKVRIMQPYTHTTVLSRH